MPTNQASIPYMKIRKISKWILSKLKRTNHASGVILPSGENYYIVHGQWITETEFKEIFVVHEPVNNINRYGENKDGKYIK